MKYAPWIFFYAMLILVYVQGYVMKFWQKQSEKWQDIAKLWEENSEGWKESYFALKGTIELATGHELGNPNKTVSKYVN